MIAPIIIVILTIAADQITKYLATAFLKPIVTLPIIQDVFHLTYTTNRGAAFGMLADHRWVFISVSIIAIVAMCVVCVLFRRKNLLFRSAIALMIGGGIGNMIDRLLLGYVVDFADFRLINFAVFNLADSFVCVGAVLMCIYILVFEFRSAKQENKEPPKEDDVADPHQ